MSELALEAGMLLKRFGGTTALRNGTFAVPSNTITSFVGRNGAGKTTSLRIAATLMPQDDGVCRVLGFDTRDRQREIRARIGFVPDDPKVPGLVTLREYLSALAGMYGVARGDIAKRVNSVMTLTGTSMLGDRRLKGLSRGERQRVAIARALVNDPELIIMDEPSAGLDPHGRVEFKEMLLILKERGKSLFLSSHLLFDVEEVSDRVILIDKGEVKFEGSVAELKKSLGSAVRWRLSFASGTPDHLALPPDCRIVTKTATSVEVEGPLDDEARAGWLSVLVSRRVDVCELTPAVPTLESLFARSLEQQEEVTA